VLSNTPLFARRIALILVAIAVEPAAAAPRVLCYPLVRGDTITSVSIRLTRHPRGWQGSALQILDPAEARFVPKAEYMVLRPTWQGCIVQPPIARPIVGGLEMLVLACSAAAAALLAFQWSVERSTAISRELEKFGAAFIREFERPLVDNRRPQPALRAELSVSPSRRSLEVRLAPADGKRYPNLADHRMNVHYDVERVVGVLNDRRFVCGSLTTRGSWVAIPFRFESNPRKEGGR
jgi:hypothetical protein